MAPARSSRFRFGAAAGAVGAAPGERSSEFQVPALSSFAAFTRTREGRAGSLSSVSRSTRSSRLGAHQRAVAIGVLSNTTAYLAPG